MSIEIVDLPIEEVIFHSFLYVYQRVMMGIMMGIMRYTARSEERMGIFVV